MEQKTHLWVGVTKSAMVRSGLDKGFSEAMHEGTSGQVVTKLVR